MNAACAIVLVALNVSCSTSKSGASASSAPDAPAGVRQAAICGPGDSEDDYYDPEVYSFAAMNHKLASFPDFAAAIGTSSVSDCQGARRFFSDYVSYATSHPDFDKNEPIQADRPDPSPPSSMDSQTEKIFAGPSALNNPVVQLTFTSDDGGSSKCTGSYIAKNWILTAAHCTTRSAVAHCIKAGIDPSSPQCTPDFLNYGRWKITSKLSDGTQLNLTTWALTYVPLNWMGRPPPAISDGGDDGPTDLQSQTRDIALLYMGDDTVLPPDVEEDGALRLSIGVPSPDWMLDFYGWGRPTPNDLRKDAFRPTFSINTETITATSDGTQSITCHGDSGGPLVRTVSVSTNDNGVQTVQAIVGVLSTGSISDANCAKPAPIPAGETATWALVENNFSDFIEPKIRRWNGNPITNDSGFHCLTRGADPNDPLDKVAECWGFPCSTDSDCEAANNEYCSRAGRDFSTCPTCDSFGGGCGCIIGQCLPGPTLDGGADGGP